MHTLRYLLAMLKPAHTSRVLTLALLLMVSLLSASPSSAAPPKELDCLALLAGTTGIPFLGENLPATDTSTGLPKGFGPLATAEQLKALPARVVFKDQRSTFSTTYAFALLKGQIFVLRAKVGVPLAGEKWRLLKLPSCLDGKITSITADEKLLFALGPGRQLYSNGMPNGSPATEHWTWRWGPYFYLGSGMTLFDDVTRWSASGFSPDATFTDTSGRVQHPIGVATAYLMRDSGRRITYLDPWLPQDESREVCTPRRGTLPLANLSSAGSTIFAVGQRGELLTRLYDFDVSGANTLLGKYSWNNPRPAADTAWQLPGPEWRTQPKPRGTITDRISIARTGVDAADRLLVVEGRDSKGRAGRFEKAIYASAWRFVASKDALRGRPLPLKRPAAFGKVDSRTYVGTIGGRKAVVSNFGPECSPAALTVSFDGTTKLSLVLHSSDGMRQAVRDRGLTDLPREYNGAIEIPAATYRTLAKMPPTVRDWVSANLSPGRFTTTPLAVTTTRMKSLSKCWKLTLDGKPARPDQLALPPDLGIVVGRLTEMLQDARPPALCL